MSEPETVRVRRERPSSKITPEPHTERAGARVDCAGARAVKSGPVSASSQTPVLGRVDAELQQLCNVPRQPEWYRGAIGNPSLDETDFLFWIRQSLPQRRAEQ